MERRQPRSADTLTLSILSLVSMGLGRPRPYVLRVTSRRSQNVQGHLIHAKRLVRKANGGLGLSELPQIKHFVLQNALTDGRVVPA